LTFPDQLRAVLQRWSGALEAAEAARRQPEAHRPQTTRQAPPPRQQVAEPLLPKPPAETSPAHKGGAVALKNLAAPERKTRPVKRDRNLPPIDLLEQLSSEAISEEEIKQRAELIRDTLRQFGLETNIVGYSVGPAVTQYAVEPGFIERTLADGNVRRQKVRVGQIASLSSDLALALAASTLRIEAPVPGQSYVGIEVPNSHVSLVSLRAVMESQPFRKIAARPLAVALGKDVSGQSVVADLGSMPHLLIAGQVGLYQCPDRLPGAQQPTRGSQAGDD
jgi:DNA segregation ATPase FtsK/SpoIIIE-like protein